MPISRPTQEFVPIKEIRDGIVILKDGSYRAVLMASTLNFALKSEDEQSAIIMQYQNFLNSLDFPIQFFIESRKIDIAPYLLSLQKAEKDQSNELLKIQIREYIQFIKNFVSITNVVTKMFYVVIPYSPSPFSAKGGGLLASFGFGGGAGGTKTAENNFEENRLQLQQRATAVQQGLVSAGVRSVPLNTEELVELFYKLFNPGELEKEVAGEQIKQIKSEHI